MRFVFRALASVFFGSVAAGALLAQTQPGSGSCETHHAAEASAAPEKPSSSADAHRQGVATRGDHVMGFDHETTTHHFSLTKTGGSIEISANDRGDRVSLEAIRGHLPHIARMFSEGDFDAPMLIHDRVAPGVPTMKRHPSAISWRYEDSAAGGRIVAITKDAEALSALHAFLVFQIEDHETGDSLAVR
jgi:hypothetical protein